MPARSERPELARRLIALIKHAKVIFVSEVFLDIRIRNALCLAIGVCRVARRCVQKVRFRLETAELERNVVGRFGLEFAENSFVSH